MRINKWMSSNCLTLNKDKCEYVVFKNECNRVPDAGVHISIDDVTSTRRPFTRYLGLYIDERLSLDVHINYVIREISKYVPILYNIRGNLTGDSLKLLYNCLIYPSLIYGNSAWGSACKNNLKLLVTINSEENN